ncbi:hypothetical protein B566_EDAN015066 [Ephemera danica]|nr:hypothetical protein B566_EDAN015066 [Ephemera danica]
MADSKNPFAGPIRRTEIPIYLEDVQRYRQETFPKVHKHVEPFMVKKVLDETFDSVGQQVSSAYSKYNEEYQFVKEKVNTGVAHASVTLDYLRQEENDLPRAGAVAMAGMAGLIMGLRGDVSKDLALNSKKYVTIGYNFISGAKPSDSSPQATISSKDADAPPKIATKKEVKGDLGQSNPADKDLYTTRT